MPKTDAELRPTVIHLGFPDVLKLAWATYAYMNERPRLSPHHPLYLQPSTAGHFRTLKWRQLKCSSLLVVPEFQNV